MYIKRKIESTILKYLESPEIIAIVGPRQCGKTTLLRKIFEIVGGEFISFEDKTALNMFNKDIENFIKLYVNGKKFLFIDEFQYAKQGGKKLKYIYDFNKIKIFISGSSAIDLTVNALKFLVGRIFIFNMHTLSFEEFLGFKNESLGKMWAEENEKFKRLEAVEVKPDLHQKFLEYFDEYMIFGGYPRVVLADRVEEKKEVLKNIYNTYFLREVRDILGLIDDYKLGKLIRGLALQIGNLIEYSELGQLAEYSHITLKKYMNFLEKTFICSFLNPYFKNRRVEIVKNPKVYFFDTGLRNSIVNDFRGVEERGDAGALLENAVFQELVKGGFDFNYWRDKKQHEVDFVIHLEGQKKIALEVKTYLKIDGVDMSALKNIHPEMVSAVAFRNKNEKMESPKNVLFYPVYVV